MSIVCENRRASDSFDVIDGGGQPDSAGDIGRAGLKSVRRLFERALFQRHTDDHLTATVVWRHGIENFGATIEGPDASRATHLVSGESREIAAPFLDIDGHMARALGGVHQRDRAETPRLLTKFSDRIDRAQ